MSKGRHGYIGEAVSPCHQACPSCKVRMHPGFQPLQSAFRRPKMSSFAGVGFCIADFQADRLPGWEPHSYGYHGDDGHAFQGSGKGRAYGPTYTTGVLPISADLMTVWSSLEVQEQRRLWRHVAGVESSKVLIFFCLSQVMSLGRCGIALTVPSASSKMASAWAWHSPMCPRTGCIPLLACAPPTRRSVSMMFSAHAVNFRCSQYAVCDANCFNHVRRCAPTLAQTPL
jgi:hypothetical protein